MFLRLLHLTINSHFTLLFQGFYEDTVLPELQKLPGCCFAELLQNEIRENEFVSLTLWNSRQDGESYERSGIFTHLLGKSQPYLAEVAEWKLVLNEELDLEYRPEQSNPTIKKLDITNDASQVRLSPQAYCVRVLTLRIDATRYHEFRNIYQSEIYPAVIQLDGCIFALLTETVGQQNEFLSITGWTTRDAITRYEQSGRFNECLTRIAHTFPQAYRWKLSANRESTQTIVASNELQLDYYRLVSSRDFCH